MDPLSLVDGVRRAWCRSALRGCDRVGDGLRLEGRPFFDARGPTQIGRNFRLSSLPVQSHLVVGAGGRLEIGDDVSIGHGASVSAQLGIAIGSGARIGPFAMILDSDFHLAGDHGAAGRSAPISIGPGVRLGGRVTVLRGASVGAGAEVLAGSVVADVIPPGSRVAGVPARALVPTSEASIIRDLPEEVRGQVKRALGLAEPPAFDAGPAQLPEWDSLATLKIILELEAHFGVTLDERDLQRVTKVGDFVPVVQQATARRGTAR